MAMKKLKPLINIRDEDYLYKITLLYLIKQQCVEHCSSSYDLELEENGVDIICTSGNCPFKNIMYANKGKIRIKVSDIKAKVFKYCYECYEHMRDIEEIEKDKILPINYKHFKKTNWCGGVSNCIIKVIRYYFKNRKGYGFKYD